jgi:protein-S-isoprenylcysteine O-methyltransferase Ste14
MADLLVDHGAAQAVVVAAVVAFKAGEAAVTYVGQRRMGGRSGIRGIFGAVVESSFATNRGTARADRGTKQLIIGATIVGFIAALTIARDAPLRVGANNWGTLALGVAIAAVGIAVRCWGVLTLGRYFRRVVAIDEQHTLVRKGPYRYLRHPAYAGDLLIVFGFGLAIGSWLGAFAALAIALLGHLPRISVEESALADAFGPAYADYARSTERLLPGVW